MKICTNAYIFLSKTYLITLHNKILCRKYSRIIPFAELYQRITDNVLSENLMTRYKIKHPSIVNLSHHQLQNTLQILKKFNITPLEACWNIHLFCMNPITMDNYGEILRECGFMNISPEHIIKYHTLVKSRTIVQLKRQGLIAQDLKLEEFILNKLQDLPVSEKLTQDFPDEETSILTVRMSILARYLKWKLSVTTEQFEQYCRNYLPLKHKPMTDIEEALRIAQDNLQFSVENIKRNAFVISSDPINTRLILENVQTLAGFDIREAIKIEPAILKNNYSSILQIRDLLEEYQIPIEAQKRCLKVYCMCPETVKERLHELTNLKEYQILSTNPRVLSMVIHKKKMLNRLSKIQAAKKQCYSLNHLVSSSKVFNEYISNFGSKVCGRDIAVLINSSLNLKVDNRKTENVKVIMKHLKKHKFWLHSALDTIDRNIKYLQTKFNDDVIFNNCQLLLYPGSEIEYYINIFLQMRGFGKNVYQIDTNYNNLNHSAFTDNQILSLVLYEIEKKYHFSGDGIWVRQDDDKREQSVN
ncbi:hypothetical protein K1T71_003243 [Dendrolimus kikuchii]|uniref:Uncharacterized protein n=1 Tax=Dendrolimus kikuchii TaxID=765133 RepID=A0ACC1DB53_9NEOP|nr:hypothetical protein K1T71_003243 [Dendrolimus kikuchii]